MNENDSCEELNGLVPAQLVRRIIAAQNEIWSLKAQVLEERDAHRRSVSAMRAELNDAQAEIADLLAQIDGEIGGKPDGQ